VAPYFEADNIIERKLPEKVTLGKKKSLEGHKIGRVTALREQEEFPDPYFLQKAFATEWCFPGIDFKHIIFVDDTRGNLKIFKSDFKETIHYNSEEDMEKLTLYHFSRALPNSEPSKKPKPIYASFPPNSPSDDENSDEF
jgi:hypothetical protein